MKKPRRILVAVDDLQHAYAGMLRRAAVLARATGARLELFHVVTRPVIQPRRVGKRWIDHVLTPEESRGAAQSGLERIARSTLLRRCRVESLAVVDQPAHEAIVRRVVATKADLIISGTRSRGLADRLVLRHTDWELVRHAPVPLLLVKSDRLRAKAVVLAAIDPLHANAKPTRLDRQILDVADGMSTVFRGPLHAIHAYMPLSITIAAGIGEPLVWNSTQLDADYSKRVLRTFTGELRGTGIPAGRRHLRIGDAAKELIACAAQIRATLVVMGAISRSELERLFVGSTAEHVLDELGCDVLIVKPRMKSLRTARKRASR
jgi:universal stress protein E